MVESSTPTPNQQFVDQAAANCAVASWCKAYTPRRTGQPQKPTTVPAPFPFLRTPASGAGPGGLVASEVYRDS